VTLRYLSVCSGIEASSVAWHPLGWEPAAFAEIAPFPSAVLAHHYPSVPNYGDFTTIQAEQLGGAVELLVGGTPCQSFSVAGLRRGLADDRGNLALQFARLAERVRPRWVVWENVPGVLSSNSGRDFGSILGALEQLGYGWAYRVLDAQYFGVPQRRRRVFVIGCLGDFRSAAAVLFERHCLQGHPAPRCAAQETAPCIPSRSTGGGGLGTDFDCDGGLIPFDTTQITSLVNQSHPRAGDPMHPLAAGAHAPAIAHHTTGAGFWQEGFGTLRAREQDSHENLVTHTLRGEGFDASEDGTGRGTPLVATFVNDSYSNATWRATDQAWPLTTSEDRTRAAPIVSFDCRGALAPHGSAVETATVSTLRSSDHKDPQLERRGAVVRRLTPKECERLQGFPDGYTNIPWRTWQEATRKGISYETLLANRGMTLRGPSREECRDGPRYKALGNSMAVPVMRWIGERIQAVAG